MNNAAPEPSTPAGDVDVLIVGGGIYGLMIALEAGKSGLRCLVLERDTVGGATSSSWFRILHGGLRYLQTFDIGRFHESVAERRWFLRFAPDLVRPMPFLMPLYGDGIRWPSAFRAAFLADAALGAGRNTGLAPVQQLPKGRVLDPAATRELYPALRTQGLKGGALWYDAVADDGPQLIARVRAQAESLGARILERVEALDLLVESGSAAGVTARRFDGSLELFRAPLVINAAGPWSAGVAERFGVPSPDLFRPSLAFNLLLEIPPPSDVGLAVSSPGTTTPTLFVYPHAGLTFAGTWHVPWAEATGPITPSEADINAFLAALNDAMPSLGVQRAHVLEVLAGLLPAQSNGGVEAADHEVLHDHGAQGGPVGLYSVSGVKFTTARRVAEKLVRMLPV